MCRTLDGGRKAFDLADVSDLTFAQGACQPAGRWRVPAANSYRHRPVPPGAPIAAEACRLNFGSLSLYLRQPTTDEVFGLTCAHVVQEAFDEPDTAPRYVFQAPRVLGGLRPLHRFATIRSAVRADPAIVNPPETVLLDILADSGSRGGPTTNQFGLGSRPAPLRTNQVTGLTGIEADYESWWYHPRHPRHRFVYKLGASTGWTAGVLVDVLDELDVLTQHGSIQFQGPIFQVSGSDDTPFAVCCDSGSPVVTPEGRVLGIVFAYSPDNDATYCFSISSIMSQYPGFVLA